MPEDFENLQLWYSPEFNLVHSIREKSIPVQLVFSPKRVSAPLRLEGTFVQIQGQTVRFQPAEACEELAQMLEERPLRMPQVCEVRFRIDYGVFAEDVVMPGEYASTGEIVGLECDDSGMPVCFDLHVKHHFTRRKTRRYARVAWNPPTDSLVRILLVRGEPVDDGEALRRLLFQAMHEQDKSHDLVNISPGGAQIRVERQTAACQLHIDDSFLVVLLPDRTDRTSLPYVFLARKMAAVQDGQDEDTGALCLHFVRELDWKNSTRSRIAWSDISSDGSQDLREMLESGDRTADLPR